MTRCFFHFILALIVSSSAGAESVPLMGAGFVDRLTQVELRLECEKVSDELNLCSRAYWHVIFPDGINERLGKGYSLPKSAQTLFGALLALEQTPLKKGLYDLERDEFAKIVFQRYINGISVNARKGERSFAFGLVKTSNHYFLNGREISSAVFADQNGEADEALQSVLLKDGWNWSEKKEIVSHNHFRSVLKMVMKRVLEDEQVSEVQGPQNLQNYLKAVQIDVNAKALMGSYGFDVSEAPTHFSNGRKVIEILSRAKAIEN